MAIRAGVFAAWRMRCCVVLLLAGAAMDSQARSEVLRFDIDGQAREVLLHVPPGDTGQPRRLVVLFHGRGDDNRHFAEAVDMERDWPDAIVAYPKGLPGETSRMRGWQSRAGQSGDRDLALVDQLLQETGRRYGTRPEHTHAAGFSNGGSFVFLLLAERAEAFASFAVIGAVRPDLAGASTPRPFLYLFGRGENPDHREHWAKTIEALTRLNRTTGPLSDYLACCKLQSPTPGGAALAFGVYNAGHTWPYRGNEWLKAFFTHAWDDPTPAAQSQ